MGRKKKSEIVVVSQGKVTEISEDLVSVPHATREHARFPFSAAHRWLNCPSSIALSEQLPVGKTESPAARKGTLQHECNEKALHAFLNFKQHGVEDASWQKTIESDESVGFEVEAAIDTAELYTKLIWEKVLEQALTGKAYGLEEKWCLDIENGLWGTCDFWSIGIDDRARRHGKIVDYKNGHYIVDIENNPQLMGYALSLLKEVRAMGKDLDIVTTAIIQPNADCAVYRECHYTPKQLETFEKKIYKAIRVILEGVKSKFKTGNWCTFCPAMAVCEEYKKNLEQKELLPLLKDKTLPEIAKISDEVLAKIALHSDELKDFLKAVDMHIIHRHEAGNPIKGCKVVEKEGKRSWVKDEEAAAEVLLNAGIIDPWRKKLITMTEAKKLLGGKDEVIAAAIVSGKKTLTIVAETDMRAAASTSVQLLE